MVITMTNGSVFIVDMPVKDEHVHTYGALIDFGDNSALDCDQRIYYSVCSDCSEMKWVYGKYADHDFATTYLSDDSYHWLTCENCNAKDAYALHTLDDDGCCAVCERRLTASGGIVYEVSADGTYAEVFDYMGTSQKIMIADTYEGVPVTAIADYAFDGKDIVSVIIPESVERIGHYAFRGCTGLTEIAIPENVTEIGDGAFEDCTGLISMTIPFVGTSKDEVGSFSNIFGYTFPYSLRTVIITGGTSIGNYAFWGFSGLTEIVIPDSVTSIGYGAFEDCVGLTKIVIPEGVVSIGRNAFRCCTGLTEVVIPDSVTSIGGGAFDEDGAFFQTENGVSYIGKWAIAFDNSLRSVTLREGTLGIADGAFSGDSKLRTITIPDTVRYIGSYAFNGCTGLTEVVIPDSVTSIGDYAFSGCTGLTEVVILGGVTSIGDYAFSGCTGLTEVVIHDGVTEIGYGAFEGCTGLTEVVIPDSVTSIGDYAFSGCTGLISMTIPFVGGGKDEADDDFFGYIFGAWSSRENATYVPDSLRTVIITGGTSIGRNAFYDCAGLTELVIPDGVTSIGENAFWCCTGLTEIVIPDGVTSIGKCAFYGCTGLTGITIPESVTSIGGSAFSDCTGLVTVYYGGAASDWGEISIEYSNGSLINASRYYYSQSKPTEAGNYWYYDENGIPTIWE